MRLGIRKTIIVFGYTAGMLMFGTASAYHDQNATTHGETTCPVDYYDYNKEKQTLDEEFGVGTQQITHCIQKRKHAKVVVEIGRTWPLNVAGTADKTQATFLTNIPRMRENYEDVHGMKIGEDVLVMAVTSGTGTALMTKKHWIFGGIDGKPVDKTDPTTWAPNPFIDQLMYGLSRNIKFFACQTASRSLGIKKDNLIEGVEFVPAGHIAVADLQLLGYALINP